MRHGNSGSLSDGVYGSPTRHVTLAIFGEREHLLTLGDLDGRWAPRRLPGDYVAGKETDKDAAARVGMEQLGVPVKVGMLLVRSTVHPNADPSEGELRVESTYQAVLKEPLKGAVPKSVETGSEVGAAYRSPNSVLFETTYPALLSLLEAHLTGRTVYLPRADAASTASAGFPRGASRNLSGLLRNGVGQLARGLGRLRGSGSQQGPDHEPER